MHALEAAGVKHGDISVLASNADDRFTTDPKDPRRASSSTAISMAAMTARRGLGLERASALRSAALRDFLPALASWLSPAWDPWWPRDGLLPRSRVQRLVARRAALLEPLHKAALARKTPTYMRRVYAAAVR